MQRAPRKANLKKSVAQNENTDKNIFQSRRRNLRSDKTEEEATHCLNQGSDPIVELETQCTDVKAEEEGTVAFEEKHTLKRRLNLTRFLFQNKKDIPSNILKTKRDSDECETPVKKVKRAPKLNPPVRESKRNKSRKTTRQQKITTAFLRDEQMFSEVAAQHCIAENFNPDEVQLALALSRSEVETKNSSKSNSPRTENIQPENSNSVEDNIRSKLQKFGFRTAAKKDYAHCFAAVFNNGQRRNKAKWANKFTALTLRDPEVQSKKLLKNIENILDRQFRTKQTNSYDYTLKPYIVQSNVLIPYGIVDPNLQIFRNMETMSTTDNLERFFVTELFPVTHLSAGHLLKDWTIIPGRDLSPDKRSKRFKDQAFQYQKFYEDLEKGILTDFAEPKNDKNDNETPITGITECQTRKSTDHTELDNFLELIVNSQKELEHENAKHLSEEHQSKSSQMCEETVELKLTASTQTSETMQVQTRPASPDLFADSDSDGVEVVEENNLNEISTYEVYSSDDVKTSSEGGCKTNSLSVKADAIDMVVDLTQDDVDTTPIDDFNKADEVSNSKTQQISKRLDFLDIPLKEDLPPLEASSNTLEEDEYVRMEIAICKALGVKPLNDTIKENSFKRFLSDSVFKYSKSDSFELPPDACNKSQEMHRNSSIASIDLTQSGDESTNDCDDNDSDHDENNDAFNDDCIVLSDDEVNYSIWKAAEVCAKTPSSKMKTFNKSVHNEENNDELETITKETSPFSEDHNFSVLDLIDVEHSFQAQKEDISKSANETFAKNSSFDLSGDIEPISKEYLNTQSDVTPKKNLSLNDMLKRQRAEFGILDSQSEPYSPSSPPWMGTPVKVTPQRNISLCNTPSTSYEPPQRLSRYSSSRKFQNFLFEVPQTPNRNVLAINPPDVDDFDEFDRLVYGTPEKRIDYSLKQTDVPAGLEKLLTAEISLDAQHITTPKTPKKSPSLELLQAITPEKATNNIDGEEIRVNDHVYIVRVTNTPKPDFAAQSEDELLKQLYNFGIKPLKRHQAIKLLEYIYNETHPIMVPESNDDCQSSMDDISINGSPKCNENLKDNKNNSKKFNLQDCGGDVLLRYSTELSAELRYDEEVYILQTNVTKKTQQPLLPFHIAWFNLICSNKELHESILMYEPIDLQEIYLFLKSLGYRYDPKDLKSFFDRRCIIFRYDLTPPDKQANRHIRKPHKKTTNNTQKTANSKTSANSQRTLDKYFSL